MDKRITGLSEGERKAVVYALHESAKSYTVTAHTVPIAREAALKTAAAFEALAELVESAGDQE